MSGPVVPPLAPAWPISQAQTIIDHAVQYGVTAAVDTVNQIKDWAGHPERIVDVINQWSSATQNIVDSGDNLGTATSGVEPYWEGHSREAFFTFATSLKSAIDSTRFPFQQVAFALTDSLTIIRDAYKAGVDLIANVAFSILEAGKSGPDIIGGIVDIVTGTVTRNPGTAVQGVRGLLGGAAIAIISLLQGFVASARDLLKYYADAVTGITQAILKLQIAESGLRAPDAAGPALNTPEWWRVHPAPRSNGVEFPPEPTEPPQGPGNNTTPPVPGTPGPEGGSPTPGGTDPGSPPPGGTNPGSPPPGDTNPGSPPPGGTEPGGHTHEGIAPGGHTHGASDPGGGSGGGEQYPKPPDPNGSDQGGRPTTTFVLNRET